MDEDAYKTLLHKARESMPEELAGQERWTVPPAQLQKEGRMTILRNFREIVGALRRDETHLAKYLLQQIGTAGQIDGDRLVFTGKVNESQVMGRLHDYAATYVECNECHSPDTHLERDGRIQLLKCEACGAHTPVKARKGVRKAEAGVQIRDGAELTVTIEEEGKRGEGMSKVEGYTVVVPKTPKDTTVKVRIHRISGDLAFAEIIEKVE